MNVNLSKLHRLLPDVSVSKSDFDGVIGCGDCPICEYLFSGGCPIDYKTAKQDGYFTKEPRYFRPCPIDRLDERTCIGYKLIKKIPSQSIRDHILYKLMRFYNKIRER